MDESSDSEKIVKECIQCASKMPQRAVKCVKCGAFQNFRRFFEFSSTVLALLVALVSVLSHSWENFAEVRKQLNVNPKNLGIATFVSGISIDSFDVVFENITNERVWVVGGAFCRINRLKPDNKIFESDTNFVRYPKGSEVLAVYDLHFSANEKESGFFVEVGKTATRSFASSRIMREEGTPFDPKIKALKPYCQTTYKTSSGGEGVYWMTLSAIDAAHLALKLDSLPLAMIDKTTGGLKLPISKN